MSFSTVDHLRWDLRQIFEMAIAEGIVKRNPAGLLFTPRDCTRPEHRTMTVDEIKRAFDALDLRERLIFKLAVLAGLRPGEIFGLRRTRISENTADIQERVYRGSVDTPKTQKSIRVVAFSASVREDLGAWLKVSPECAEGWLFPSEKLEIRFHWFYIDVGEPQRAWIVYRLEIRGRRLKSLGASRTFYRTNL